MYGHKFSDQHSCDSIHMLLYHEKEEEGVSEGGKHVTPKAEPVYDTPQVLGESCAHIELKENTCYTSKLAAL